MAGIMFEDFFQFSLDMLCILSSDGHFKELNASFARTLGWAEDEMLSRPYLDFVHPDDHEQTQREMHALATGTPAQSFENRYRCSDGSYKNLQWTAFPQEETGLIFVTARDITRPVEASQRFRIALDASPAAIIMADTEGNIRLVNMEAERLFGYERDDLLGHSIEMLLPSKFQAGHVQLISNYFQNAKRRPMGRGRHLVGLRKNGYEFPVEIGLNPIELEDGLYVLASIIDLTLQKDLEQKLIEAADELKEANDQLSRLATTDDLTGLLNRRGFNKQLQVYINLMQRMTNPLSLLLIDLDNFKQMNDKFGHTAGDKSLQEIANILLRNLRGSDVVARYGGEEFAIILPSTDAHGALQLAEKIRAEVETHVWDRMKLTISVGVSTMMFPFEEADMELDYPSLLVSAADRALYQSKERGRNQVSHASGIKNSGDTP